MVKEYLNSMKLALGLGTGGIVPNAITTPAQPAPRVEVRKILQRPAIGSMGTDIYAGYIGEEYLSELTGNRRAKIYDRMRRSDAQIKMLLSAVKNPIKAATWEVEPADETPEAVADAELIRHILFEDMDRPLRKVIGECLTFIEFGHCFLEKTFRLVVGDPKFGVYHGIASLDWISPKTIERFNVDPANGKLVSITQMADGDLKRYVDIPALFCMRFGLDVEGANYEGISWLRPIYGNYVRKNVYLKLNAIGIEKHAIPTPIIKVDQGNNEANSPSYNNLIAALQLYSSGEANYLTVPRDTEIDMSGNDFDPSKVEASIDAEDKRMAKAWLANFFELGMSGGGGSFALGDSLSDYFLLGLDHLANEVAETFNSDLIPDLMKMNRGPRSKYPRLKFSGISDKAGKELAEIIDLCVKNKVIVPDDALEKNIRARYGLPKASLIGQRDTTPPAPFGGGFGGAQDPSNPPVPPAPAPGKPTPNASGAAHQTTLSERIRKKLYG